MIKDGYGNHLKLPEQKSVLGYCQALYHQKHSLGFVCRRGTELFGDEGGL